MQTADNKKAETWVVDILQQEIKNQSATPEDKKPEPDKNKSFANPQKEKGIGDRTDKELKKAKEALEQSEKVQKLYDLKNTKIALTSFRDKKEVLTLQIYDELIKESRDESKAKNTFKNLLTIIQRDPVFDRLVIYDKAKGEIVFLKKYFLNLDDLHTQIMEYLVVNYKLESTVQKIEFMINRIAYNNQINSVVIALEALPPAPEKDPLFQIVDYIETPDKIMLYEALELFFKKCSLQIYINEFDRDLTFPNDFCVIFQGSQGIGKTVLIQHFSLPNLYFDSGTLDIRELTTRDGLLKIVGMDIVELGEFRSGQVEKLKALISAIEHTLRQPYARGNTTCTRTVSYLGSTNHLTFLSDPSGNRRFAPFKIASINFDLFRKNAELFHLVRAYYRDWAKSFINENRNNLNAALFNIQPSNPLQSFMLEAREESRIVTVNESLIDEYIEKVKFAVKNNDFINFPKREIEQHFEYYSSPEAALMIYPYGRVPYDFSHIFTETMRNYNFIYTTKQVNSKRNRIWLPE